MAFFVPFIFSEGNFFNICVLSWCIVYWIHFQNIYTFTYHKTLLHTLWFSVAAENIYRNFLSFEILNRLFFFQPSCFPVTISINISKILRDIHRKIYSFALLSKWYFFNNKISSNCSPNDETLLARVTKKTRTCKNI